jgi:OOP family OmpA-OmpF porin
MLNAVFRGIRKFWRRCKRKVTLFSYNKGSTKVFVKIEKNREITMNKKLITSAAVLAAFVSTPSFAVEPGGYVTASFGTAEAEVSEEGETFKGDDTAFKLGGGYAVNKNFAIEGYFADYGKAEDTVTVFADEFDVAAEATAIVVQAVGIFPASPKFDLFAKAGLAMWDSEVFADGASLGDDDGSDIIFGLGGAFFITPQAAIRVEYEMSEFDDVDVTMLSAGFSYHFPKK